MKIAPWLGAVVALGLVVSAAPAGTSIAGPFLLARTKRHLHGQVIDYTHNHGHDRRIWSEAIQQPRDLYVYLPPGYDPAKRYPLALYLHTFREDEIGALQEIIPRLDKAMASGQLPPFIVACPDGSIKGHRTFRVAGSFFVNSKAGKFEDYIIQDVWSFMLQNYPIRPEREAHALLGASMGGFAAFNLAFKHQDKFKIAAGLFPPLNLRWVDCHDCYLGNFDPNCWGWRTELRPKEVVAQLFGIPVVRMWQVLSPVYGDDPDPIGHISRENPIEMLQRLDIRPGQLELYVAYAGKDQFNLDAQVESFLYVAKRRGLEVGVGYAPKGRHGPLTAMHLMPGIFDWLNARLGPYAPPP